LRARREPREICGTPAESPVIGKMQGTSDNTQFPLRYNESMSPRQKDVVWATGIVVFVFAGCMWASTQNDLWGIATLSIIAPWFLYTGLRTMYDKKYRHERALWAERIAAQGDGKPFNREKAEQNIKEAGNPHVIWAPHSVVIGFILLLLLFSIISKHVPFSGLQ
jgi:hypothetical protein